MFLAQTIIKANKTQTQHSIFLISRNAFSMNQLRNIKSFKRTVEERANLKCRVYIYV